MLDSRGPQSVESPKQKFCVIYKACAEHFTGLRSHVEGQCDNIDSGATFCLFTASAVSSVWLNLGLKPVIPRTGADERRESTGFEYYSLNTDSSCIYSLSLPSRKKGFCQPGLSCNTARSNKSFSSRQVCWSVAVA